MVMTILGIIALLISALILYYMTKGILVDPEPIVLTVILIALHTTPIIYIALTLLDKIW